MGVATAVLMAGGVFFLISSMEAQTFEKAFVKTVIGFLMSLAAVLTGTILVTDIYWSMI